MADDTGADAGQVPAAAQTPAQSPDPQTQNTTPDDQASTEDVFDKYRALATIKKLRGFEKTAEQLGKRLADYEAREKEAERAKLSEQERLSAQLKDREAELERVRRDMQDRTNRHEVERQAAKLGVIDPDAAVRLLDWSSLEYTDSGQPKDVKAALEALVAERPWLAQQTQTTQPGRPATSVTNPATRTPDLAQRRYSSAELADRDFYVKNREDIILAMRQGRIDN